jgi:hypothetical protein
MLSTFSVVAVTLLLLLLQVSHHHNEALWSHLLARGCTSRWVIFFCLFVTATGFGSHVNTYMGQG